MDFEHAVLEFGTYLVASGGLGKREASHERAVATFDAMILLTLLLLLELAFADDRQDAVVNGDLHILFLDLRQFRFDQVLLVVVEKTTPLSI
jgi:hypothetical protein